MTVNYLHKLALKYLWFFLSSYPLFIWSNLFHLIDSINKHSSEKVINKSVFFQKLGLVKDFRTDCKLFPQTGCKVFLFFLCFGAGFFLTCKDLGRMFDRSVPTCIFFFKAEISLSTLIPLFTPELVHSGSASYDDCDQVFPEKLRVSSFPDTSDRVPTMP